MADEADLADRRDDEVRIPAQSQGRVLVITGAMASGKSTVAELLASRFERSVHVRGDSFRRMIVNGRQEMTLHPSDEATAQLKLRYDMAAAVADQWAAAGYDAIVQDVIIGAHLQHFIDAIATPQRHLVVLSPSVSALEWREQQRHKAGYVYFSPGAMDQVLRQETQQIGYWLDSSAQSPSETVDEILANLDLARV